MKGFLPKLTCLYCHRKTMQWTHMESCKKRLIKLVEKGEFKCNAGNLREFLKIMYADEKPVYVEVHGNKYEVKGLENNEDHILIQLGIQK